MPKRLVQKSAVVEKGLPFEEEGDFIIVQRALDKVHIDEIIEISKKNREDEVIHYKYEEAIKGPIAQKKKPVKKEKTAEATETERDVKREEINIKEIRPDGTEFSEKIEKTEKKTDTIAFPFPPPPPPPPPPRPKEACGRARLSATTLPKTILSTLCGIIGAFLPSDGAPGRHCSRRGQSGDGRVRLVRSPEHQVLGFGIQPSGGLGQK